MRALLNSRAFRIAIRIYWGGVAIGLCVIALSDQAPWWLRLALIVLALLSAAVALRASHRDAVESALFPPFVADCTPHDTFADPDHAQPRIVATQPVEDSSPAPGNHRG